MDVSRRRFLGVSAGALAAGRHAVLTPGARRASDTISFYGPHQGGIATKAQNCLCFAAFDVGVESVPALRELMQEWSAAAARMCAALPGSSGSGKANSVPLDTGEALGRPASHLTVTFGFGPSLFEVNGQDRLGLMDREPRALRPLPDFLGDAIDPAQSDGDICVQACADDPQVAFHAIHELTMLGLGACSLRWMQTGFGRTSTTTRKQPSARNLMGFRDGTDNIRADDVAAMNRWVWVGNEGPDWMRGGTYMVARKIDMLLEPWDASTLREQEETFGRRKISGAPLTGHAEYDPIDLKAVDGQGKPIIPGQAHIRQGSPQYNDGRRLLRRGYSFSDPSNAHIGGINAGLFFICFQRDPHDQFVRIQKRLAQHDHLNRYTTHVGSALFAVPGGARVGEFMGFDLLA